MKVSLTGALTLQKELLATLAGGIPPVRYIGVDFTFVSRTLAEQSVKLALHDDPGQDFGSIGISKYFDGTLFVLDLDETSPRYTLKKLTEAYSHLCSLQSCELKPALVAFRGTDERKIANVTEFLKKHKLPGIRVANGEHLESALQAMTVLIQASPTFKDQQEMASQSAPVAQRKPFSP